MPSDAYSNRVSSITDASQHFLKRIGVWDYVEHARTNPVHQMQVWDGISGARITFDASEIPESSEMARMTENLNLQRALLRKLSDTPSVQVIQSVKVESIEREAGDANHWPLVHLSNGLTLRARLLVGADGFNSPVRSFAGISSYGWSYDTQAVVATLNHAPRGPFQAPNNTAYQRFLPTGPIAFLPLSPGISSLVWSTKPHLAAVLSKSSPGVLEQLINAAFRLPETSLQYIYKRLLEGATSSEEIKGEIAFRERSDGISSHSAYASATSLVSEGGIPPDDADALPPLVTSIQPSTIASFPLRYNHAESYLGEGAGSRTVLVGDAAHTVHPLAGQGLNLGLGDVDALSRCIAQALTQGSDIGSYTTLMPYARERYFENHKVMSAVDKLHKVYSSTAQPVVWARSVGVEVINELDSVKAALMINAGAGSQLQNASGWDLLAKSIENLAGFTNTSKMIGSTVGAGIQELAKNAGQRIFGRL
ncbi:COQ6 monooxygenase [Rhizopogon vinicolor AM-OR11-026]|uniref:COQ6 monooxygenase n=1 Tax=Rhizopogon vinicolor AM-OR11-026 TaxID=1314800 RepID=A0A1B7NEJ7_9AGAM|nr:COQ6 monooxygenase [Rhizopogon vinicolor AM-OR11-026]